MKYLFYEKETETRGKVYLVYNVTPPEELLKKDYIVVNTLVEPENTDTKISTLYVNPTSNEVWYEYEDKPQTEEEKLQAQINGLQSAIAELSMMNISEVE